MYNLMLSALLTIAPYNSDAFILAHALLYGQVHYNQLLGFLMGLWTSLPLGR